MIRKSPKAMRMVWSMSETKRYDCFHKDIEILSLKEGKVASIRGYSLQFPLYSLYSAQSENGRDFLLHVTHSDSFSLHVDRLQIVFEQDEKRVLFIPFSSCSSEQMA